MPAWAWGFPAYHQALFLFLQCSRPVVTYDPMDEVQIAEINSQVRRYLEGTLEEIDVRSPLWGCCAQLAWGSQALSRPHPVCMLLIETWHQVGTVAGGSAGPLVSGSFWPPWSQLPYLGFRGFGLYGAAMRYRRS